MKYLALMFLVSCASSHPNGKCSLWSEKEANGLITRRYSCFDNYRKICRYDRENGQSLGCYSTRIE